MKVLIMNQHIEDVVGGSERQCDLIAKHLTEFGHEVIYGAIKAKKNNYGTSYRVYPLPSITIKAFGDLLKEVKPDVVYWRYNRKFLFNAGMLCKIRGCKIVFAVSSLKDITKWKYSPINKNTGFLKYFKSILSSLKNTLIDRINYLGYKFMDGVVLQKKDTLHAVPKNIKQNRKIHIYNSMEVSKTNSFNWKKPYIIWVANIKKGKNPEKVIKIADKIKHKNVDILMIGKIQDNSYNQMLRKENLPSNVHYLGPKKVDEVDNIIANSLFLIHTCNPEGLPNNLIQSWLLGKPTISLYYDPDSLIETNKLGYLSKSEELMIKQIIELIDDTEVRNRIGNNAREVANCLFDPKQNIRKLESFLSEI
ncbi:glycosyltransferase family 4 protein [Oceanobacillus sp. AG]|uniref:glycosyltransferase family 4 protein n=1 Tax=Oceanobacillus sp. AG TaxID=2681969 RepID=UPI0012EBD7A7|nr:glycosyltransferase family 4 protein [Oceanobacillus sp. AG]